MCTESFEVGEIDTAREAYEVREYLRGIPHIDDVECSILGKSVKVEYDESKLDRDDILDEIEHAGCTPAERKKSFFGRVKETVA